MLTEYLEFSATDFGDGRKTMVWNVLSRSTRTVLGTIRWHGPWRAYVFHPSASTLFNAGCLTDIASFCADNRSARALIFWFPNQQGAASVNHRAKCYGCGTDRQYSEVADAYYCGFLQRLARARPAATLNAGSVRDAHSCLSPSTRSSSAHQAGYEAFDGIVISGSPTEPQPAKDA